MLTRSFGLIQRNIDVTWVSLPLSVALIYIPIPIAGFAVVAQALVAIARALRGDPLPAPEGRCCDRHDEILGLWLVAILVGVPLYAAIGLAAVVFVAIAGFPADVVPQKLAQSINSFPLLAAPLFVLMGNIMNSAGITDRIFGFATACPRAGDDRGGAGLVPLDRPRAPDADAADRRAYRQPAAFPARGQRAPAAGRLLHGSVGSDADPHPDPDATHLGIDPIQFGVIFVLNPDDRDHYPAGRRRDVHHIAHRRHQL